MNDDISYRKKSSHKMDYFKLRAEDSFIFS